MLWKAHRFGLAGQLAQEFLLVHAVFERLAAVNKDHRNFVGEAPAQVVVGVNIDLTPTEAAAALQLGEALFHDLAEVASPPGIHHYFSRHCFRLGAHKELRESSK